VRLPFRNGAAAIGAGDRLEARGVKVHFAGVRAVDGVDLTLERSEILGLIGPNGAGKTTLVNALSGFQEPTQGAIALGSADVTSWPPERLARHGLARTFQNVRLFSHLSAFENVETAAVAVGLGRRAARARAAEALETLGLSARAHVAARALPHGEQRRLGIARALASGPAFLLLDEPAAGLNEDESHALGVALRALHKRFECGLLVIEHDMEVIMTLCDRVQVLSYGTTICIGTPAEVQDDAAVVTAYLGAPEERSGA
jgi:ABC-type branched-subunit amino acid transport system ATPase component